MVVFQFHKGTIDTEVLSVLIRKVNNFNSIKVRLILLSWITLHARLVISIP